MVRKIRIAYNSSATGKVASPPIGSWPQDGFTFVEAIVVAVIMAILAMVAVPMYSGYVRNQRRQAAVAVAQTASVTAASWKRRNGVAPNSAQLNAAITLPNPAQFVVSVVNANGIDYVRAVEQSNPSDTLQSDVQF